MLELGFFISFVGLISMLPSIKQFIICLICLEFVTLGLFLMMIFMMFSSSLALYLIVLSVCEASLGLSLLVGLLGKNGSDLIQMSNYD